ncbi:DNA mismatch repair endonuclease MutL [Hazenella coriacea]|uniref:DNA mismatch repair protein MutL n=1 Tax=Hazenella coriacea TaxID=1179467 RepID=A0A4R3L8G8_9BACL|nr:DNA mismatch repair endonuclease MutL [Hazenella coriacea]TCS93806.1 DNA mismatch repair protein MutL [Hazenella coriacea]
MGNIQILEDHLANQIAAGEVVERPSSIVKELVENAIDASATRIQVQIEEGGISLIRVSDNGRGMEKEDAILAFSRHATSKIKRERDLFSIRTLGFRGEALPSIASVARVVLTTSPDSSELAVKVQIEGGDQLTVEDTSHSQGTEVIVRDLFYNTPARLKYLKTVNTEVSHVADVVGRLALAHPKISFQLTHHQRELFRTSGDGKLLHVLHSLYGKQVSSQLIPFSSENMDFRLSGFVSKPELTRSSRSYLSMILNGRYVRSVAITQSILRSYGTLLPTGRYPLGVVHIEMDPKLVDVNVHPSKLEVRLSKEKECCQWMEQTLKEAFQQQRFVPVITQSPGQAKVDRVVVQDRLRWEEVSTPQASSAYPSRVEEGVQRKTEIRERGQTITANPLPSESETIRATEDEPPVVESQEKPSFSYQSPLATLPDKDDHQPCLKEKLPRMEPLSQIHGTYIIAQSEDGFYLFDQHAAHERIYYEKFSKKMEKSNHQQQPLLMPIPIDCSPAEAEVLSLYMDYLQQWGLQLEPFGGATFLVRSYPAWFPEGKPDELIFEMIDWLKEHGKVDVAMLRDASAKMMSCKAAIKANRHLRKDEMEGLLQQLNHCKNPFTCPHGRPIFVHFSTYELEKMFKRVM